MTEDEMVGCHHRLNGHKFEPDLGDSKGQGSLAFCCSWGCKESDTTEQLSNNNSSHNLLSFIIFLMVSFLLNFILLTSQKSLSSQCFHTLPDN